MSVDLLVDEDGRSPIRELLRRTARWSTRSFPQQSLARRVDLSNHTNAIRSQQSISARVTLFRVDMTRHSPHIDGHALVNRKKHSLSMATSLATNKVKVNGPSRHVCGLLVFYVYTSVFSTLISFPYDMSDHGISSILLPRP